ncbi:uncharacterized protein [Eucyclogobius newberryi]|uniref:uncharacterized protein n=1 Tax=Eucyclogobius newberryi TaxID=166745 RepID=UPI003B5BA8FE
MCADKKIKNKLSAGIEREKVLQTTQVRTSIKSDLSWIQKLKRAADVKESSKIEKDETSLSLRQDSYVLMTAKKFESATGPPQSPKELTNPKEPDTSENTLPDPVSPEPTVASTTTGEKNDVEPPKSKDTAEISTKVVKEGGENEIIEAHIVNDAASVDESVASMVPDILAESVFKSPPPQESCNEVSKANTLDALSDSLVEPILSSESEEADVNPSSETATDQNAYESAETGLNGNTNTLNDDKSAVADLPQVSPASSETLSTAKEVIVLSKTTTVEVTVDQNDAELAQEEACAEAEVAKEPEVSAISSDGDVPQDNTETKETYLNSTSEVSGTASAEVDVDENNVDPLNTGEEAFEVPKEPEVTDTISDLPQDNADPTETQTTSTKLVIIESRTPNAEVIEQKAPDITAISSDVSLADSEVQSPGQPSTNGDKGTIVEDADVAVQGTAEEVQKTENAISVVDPEVTGLIEEEEKDLEEKTTIDETVTKDSLKNPNQAEHSVVSESAT